MSDTTAQEAHDTVRISSGQQQGETTSVLNPEHVSVTKQHVSTYANLVKHSWRVPNQRLRPARFYLACLYFMTVSTARLLDMDDVLGKSPESRGVGISKYAAEAEKKDARRGKERSGGEEATERDGQDIDAAWERVVEDSEGAEEFRQ